MSKKTEISKEDLTGDPILDSLAINNLEALDACDESENHGVLILGARLNDDDPEDMSISTFMAVAGYHEILAEGLLSELSNQVESGNTALFSLLRDTVRALEEHLGLSPDDSLEEDDDSTPVLH